MPYNCSYATDHGCSCSAWVRDGEQYCAKHKEPMAKIDDLEKEINDVVKKAREK